MTGFLLGFIIGAVCGMFIMCLIGASGNMSREEEKTWTTKLKEETAKISN